MSIIISSCYLFICLVGQFECQEVCQF